MTAFMLLWNQNDTSYEEAVKPLLDAFRSYQKAGDSWRFRAFHQVRLGDTVFLRKSGDPPRGIFGIGAVTGTPQQIRTDNGKPRWLVPVEFQHLVDPKSAFIIPDDHLPQGAKVIRAAGMPLEDSLVSKLWEHIAHHDRYGAVELAREMTKLTKIPSSTEREQLTRQRVGQDIFRRRLLHFWNGRCCVTGLDQEELLRASHIKAWAECDTDDERLAADNGLLLAVHLDAAFDAGLMTIDQNGVVRLSPKLSSAALALLGIGNEREVLNLTARHHSYLQWHRENRFRC